MAVRLSLPAALLLILLTTEDKRFFNHRGIDWIGTIRALLVNASVRGWAQGASTITQQLVRIRKPIRNWPESRSLSTKLGHMRLAARDECSSSKESILRRYLSAAYLGRGYAGIQNAAIGYFGVQPTALTPAQSLFLVDRLAMPSIAQPSRVVQLVNRTPIKRLFDLSQIVDLAGIYDQNFQCGEEIWVRLVKSHKRSAERTFTY